MNTTTKSDRDIKTEAKQKAKEVAADAKHEVADLTAEAGEGARRLVEEAKSATRQQLEEQGGHLAEAAKRWAEDLRQMADASRDNPMAKLAREGGNRLEELASRYENAGLEGLERDITRFARRRPLVFIGGTFAVGLVAARLFKNTDGQTFKQAMNDDRPDDRQTGQHQPSASGSGDAGSYEPGGTQQAGSEMTSERHV